MAIVSLATHPLLLCARHGGLEFHFQMGKEKAATIIILGLFEVSAS